MFGNTGDIQVSTTMIRNFHEKNGIIWMPIGQKIAKNFVKQVEYAVKSVCDIVQF